jgi:4-amino-4-deoxy-L-arabinose transferase-like glycosyltransferase
MIIGINSKGIISMETNRWPFFAFLGTSFIFLFFNLWGRSLENHDYLRYAEVAKEMIQSGDWIIPRFNGEIFLHKPPLLFWLIVLPSKIYGSVTPFLARLPSAFFAWVGGLIVYLWGRKMWGGERYGLVSSGVLISSSLYFWQGRIARTDMVFSVLVLLSLYFFYLSYFGKGNYLPPPLPAPKLRQAGSPSPVEGEGVIRSSSGKGRGRRKECILTLLSFAFMGMAGLTKGPVGVLFPLLIIFLFVLIQRQWKKLFQKEFILGYLVISFILGSWVILFIHQAGWDTALGVWRESKILTRHGPFYLYLYRIWIDFAPWSIFFPLLFTYLWKKNKSKDEKFLILWFFCLLLLLTLFPHRASKYVLPAFPALALLMGGFWRKWSLVPFLIIFFGAVLVWHGYEYSLIRKNHIRTPGLALHQVLSPYREKEILGYQMDIDILGKINFYGDRLVLRIRRVEDLKKMVRQRKDALILTTDRSLQDLMGEGFYLTVLKKIDIKGEILILASLNTI